MPNLLPKPALEVVISVRWEGEQKRLMKHKKSQKHKYYLIGHKGPGQSLYLLARARNHICRGLHGIQGLVEHGKLHESIDALRG